MNSLIMSYALFEHFSSSWGSKRQRIYTPDYDQESLQLQLQSNEIRKSSEHHKSRSLNHDSPEQQQQALPVR